MIKDNVERIDINETILFTTISEEMIGKTRVSECIPLFVIIEHQSINKGRSSKEQRSEGRDLPELRELLIKSVKYN